LAAPITLPIRDPILSRLDRAVSVASPSLDDVLMSCAGGGSGTRVPGHQGLGTRVMTDQEHWAALTQVTADLLFRVPANVGNGQYCRMNVRIQRHVGGVRKRASAPASGAY
jgi:hypothetical protein